MIDILVLLTAMLLEKKQYSRKTFNIYRGYVFLLTAIALLDYFIDTWYLQNIAIFFFVHDYFYRSYDTGFRSVDGYQKRIIAF